MSTKLNNVKDRKIPFNSSVLLSVVEKIDAYCDEKGIRRGDFIQNCFELMNVYNSQKRSV